MSCRAEAKLFRKCKSLGVDVARQINEQLGGGSYQNAGPANGDSMQEGEVIHFSQ